MKDLKIVELLDPIETHQMIAIQIKSTDKFYCLWDAVDHSDRSEAELKLAELQLIYLLFFEVE